jgi:hypothetical protein
VRRPIVENTTSVSELSPVVDCPRICWNNNNNISEPTTKLSQKKPTPACRLPDSGSFSPPHYCPQSPPHSTSGCRNTTRFDKGINASILVRWKKEKSNQALAAGLVGSHAPRLPRDPSAHCSRYWLRVVQAI